MKLNTFRKFKFTADLYTFTVTQDAEGGDIRTYEFNREINVHATTSNQGRLFVYLQVDDDDVEPNDQLINLKDVNGNEVQVNGIFQITTVEPLLNLWGVREGFKARAQFVGFDS